MLDHLLMLSSLFAGNHQIGAVMNVLFSFSGSVGFLGVIAEMRVCTSWLENVLTQCQVEKPFLLTQWSLIPVPPLLGRAQEPRHYLRAMLVAQAFCAIFYLVVSVRTIAQNRI